MVKTTSKKDLILGILRYAGVEIAHSNSLVIA